MCSSPKACSASNTLGFQRSCVLVQSRDEPPTVTPAVVEQDKWSQQMSGELASRAVTSNFHRACQTSCCFGSGQVLTLPRLWQTDADVHCGTTLHVKPSTIGRRRCVVLCPGATLLLSSMCVCCEARHTPERQHAAQDVFNHSSPLRLQQSFRQPCGRLHHKRPTPGRDR
jgi:hypothetical protein